MRFLEICNESEQLNEFGGSRSFPGFGQKLFTRGFYEYIAFYVSHIADQVVKQHLAEWFADIFSKDNSSFKAENFIKAAAAPTGRGYRPPTPRFQARHFYYIATLIHREQNPEVQTFLAHWTGEILSRTNGQFKQERWDHFCQTGENPVEKRPR